MSKASSDLRSEGLAAGVQLAARWAEFVGALVLYPDTNVRVRIALDRLQSSLKNAADRTGVQLHFEGKCMLVNAHRLEVKQRSKAKWLKDRFDRAILAGVRLEPDVPKASLISFSRRLLDLYAGRRRATDGFAELWPVSYEGMQLLERRFDGGFGTLGSSDSRAGFEGSGGAGKTGEAGSRLRLLRRDDQPPEERDLVDALSRDEGLVRELMALDSAGAQAGTSGRGVTVSARALIQRIVDVLPADVVADPERAVKVARAALRESRTRQRDPGNDFLDLAAEISQKFFGRADARVEVPLEPAAADDQGARAQARPTDRRESRPEDKGLAEDLAAFQSSLDKLPHTSAAQEVLEADVDHRSEQLGVFLHELVSVDDPRDYPGLERGLAYLLGTPEQPELTILRQFLLPAASDGEHGRNRLVAYLRRRESSHLIRTSGALDAMWLMREFPYEFFDFVDSLDLANPRDVGHLRQLVGTIGAKRIHDGREVLRRDLRLLSESFTRCVFEDSTGAFLPFGRMVLAEGGERYKQPLVHYLWEAAEDELDRELIEVVQEPDWLSTEYLLLIAGEGEEAKVEYQRQAILCRFLRATEEMPELEERRVRAIQLLRHFPSVPVLKLLQRMVGERRFGLLRVHSRPVRRAALEVLHAFSDPNEWVEDDV